MMMKFLLSFCLFLFCTAPLQANLVDDLDVPTDYRYQDLKNKINSDHIYQDEVQNLQINHLRTQCMQNDTNIGVILCLNDLTHDLSQKITSTVQPYMDAQFRQAHTAWQNYSIKQCDVVAELATGGSLGPRLHAECLSYIYQDYLNLIKNMYRLVNLYLIVYIRYYTLN